MNDDVRDAAWILIHHVDDFRASDLPGLYDKAALFVNVARRYGLAPAAAPEADA
jgi:hypothetical protein